MKVHMKFPRFMTVLVLVGTVSAAPIIQRVEVGGVPQVLQITAGAWYGKANTTGRLGYHFEHHRIYWSDHSASGHTYFWGESPN